MFKFKLGNLFPKVINKWKLRAKISGWIKK